MRTNRNLNLKQNLPRVPAAWEVARLWAAVKDFILRLWRRRALLPVIPTVETPPPIPLAAPEIPPLATLITRRAKWVKPKGLEKLKKNDEPRQPKPQRERKPPRPASHPATDDPEQWGQYYFRDAILDQLEMYFSYLKRMKTYDPEAYDLHRQLGISLMPNSAIKSFETWRSNEEALELSGWWKKTRPSFGAVAYGIHSEAERIEKTLYGDRPPSGTQDLTPISHRLVSLHRTNINTKWGKAGAIWIPKFLYFRKYTPRHRPLEFQHINAGDVYAMTVYWDHTDDRVKTKKGGTPQDYGIVVTPDGNVEVLRMRASPTMMTIRRGRDRGKQFSIPSGGWHIPTDYLTWTQGLERSPREMLANLFIEAALMYESAELGSMVRIEVIKDNLVAVFGVEIKRTSYFFKDRDITVNIHGRRQRIFHIVRPHQRITSHGVVDVPLHFRGLKQFTWAGYNVGISVPGKDHFHLPEFNVASHDDRHHKNKKGLLSNEEVGRRLHQYMKEGVGKR